MTILDCRPPSDKQPKRHITIADKQAIVAALATVLDPTEHHHRVRVIAAAKGVAVSTVYDWEQKASIGQLKAREARPADPQFLEHVLVCFYSHRGDASATCRELIARGMWEHSIRHFQNFMVEQVDRLVRLGGKLDEKDARLLGTYISYTVPHRDYEWQIDLVDLCVEVLLPDGTTAHMWAVAIVDKRSGVTRGWCVTIGQPTADAVVQALIMAIRPRHERLVLPDGWVMDVTMGGAPKILRCDNGLQLLAELVQLLLCETGTICMPAAEYLHTAQGEIERWNGEAKRFSGDLFGTTRGAKTIREDEPFRAGEPVMDLETVERRFAEHVHEFNRTVQRGQEHCPLGLYAGLDKPTELYGGPVPDESILSQFSMSQIVKPRPVFKVTRGCVRFRNRRWTAKGMASLKVDRVELWVSNVDEDYLEVRAEGLRFQVQPNDELDPDDAEDIIEGRGERVRRSNGLRLGGADHSKARALDAQADTDAAADAEDDELDDDDHQGLDGDLLDGLDDEHRDQP